MQFARKSIVLSAFSEYNQWGIPVSSLGVCVMYMLVITPTAHKPYSVTPVPACTFLGPCITCAQRGIHSCCVHLMVAREHPRGTSHDQFTSQPSETLGSPHPAIVTSTLGQGTGPSTPSHCHQHTRSGHWALHTIVTSTLGQGTDPSTPSHCHQHTRSGHWALLTQPLSPAH